MLGAFGKKSGLVSLDSVKEALRHVFSGPKEKFLEGNLRALEKGAEAV